MNMINWYKQYDHQANQNKWLGNVITDQFHVFFSKSYHMIWIYNTESMEMKVNLAKLFNMFINLQTSLKSFIIDLPT